MGVSEKQIQLYTGGNYALLEDYLNHRDVKALPFNEARFANPSGNNYVLIPSSLVSGNLAVGTSTATTNGGLMVAALAGAVGTGATTTVTDTLGNILNKVELRDPTTHEPVIASGFQLFGLMQAASTATDGTAIGGGGSENLQMSICYMAANGTVTLSTYTGNVEFTINRVYSLRYLPTIIFDGGVLNIEDILGAPYISRTKHTVTTAFVVNETFNIQTGVGGTAGVTSIDANNNDAITLAASANAAYADKGVLVYRNGVAQDFSATGDVVWDSTTTFHFTSALAIGEQILIAKIA